MNVVNIGGDYKIGRSVCRSVQRRLRPLRTTLKAYRPNFSQGAASKASEEAVIVPPVLDQKSFAKLKMHQIHFPRTLLGILCSLDSLTDWSVKLVADSRGGRSDFLADRT